MVRKRIAPFKVASHQLGAILAQGTTPVNQMMTIWGHRATGAITALVASSLILFFVMTSTDDSQTIGHAVDLVVGILQLQFCVFSIITLATFLAHLTNLRLYAALVVFTVIVHSAAMIKASPWILMLSWCVTAFILFGIVIIWLHYNGKTPTVTFSEYAMKEIFGRDKRA